MNKQTQIVNALATWIAIAGVAVLTLVNSTPTVVERDDTAIHAAIEKNAQRIDVLVELSENGLKRDMDVQNRLSHLEADGIRNELSDR
jgi:hypothetical protein